MTSPPDPDSVKATVAAITQHDPEFNLDALLAEAQQAFWLLGQAHAKCQPELCAAVLSPELARLESSSIEAACQKRNVKAPDDDDAKTGRLFSIASDASGDTVTVHFDSTWRPVAGDRSAEREARDGRAERRVQNWCFRRPPNSRTVNPTEGQRCANCGAALSASAGTCRYCGAVIGVGSGWRVIRIDDVSAEGTAEATAAMESIVAGIMAAQRADRAAQQTPPGRRHRRVRWVKPVLSVLIILAIVVVVAAAGSNRLHQDVANVLPFIRHPELTGTVDLRGQIAATNLSALQVPPLVELGGSCKSYSDRSSWDFKAKLPDSSTFHLKFALPPDQAHPGTYRPSELTLSASADNSQQSSSWSGTPSTVAVLTVGPSGGGSLTFRAMPPGETGGSPLSGSLSWTCSVK
jgi:hypothetical protein